MKLQNNIWVVPYAVKTIFSYQGSNGPCQVKKCLQTCAKCTHSDHPAQEQSTLQPLYKMIHYNTVLDITRFNDGFQKCIDYIEK